MTLLNHSRTGLEIDCDALTDKDIDAAASFIASMVDCRFMVQDISQGGCRLAAALEKYDDAQAPFVILLIDEVLVTASSMNAAKDAQPPQVHPDDVVGWVIFARGELPSWVNAMFVLGD